MASDKVTQVRISTGRSVGAVRYILGEGDPVDHCPTIGNTQNWGNLREYLRLWLGNQTHIYGQLKYSSIHYMYTCDSLRFFNSIHNTQVNLSVTCRRSLFSPFAFLPFATRSEGQVYFYASNEKYIFITFVVFPRSIYLHTSS